MKLITLVFAMFISLTVMGRECNVGASVDGTGTVQAGSASKCWDWYKNSNGASLAVGTVVCLDLTDDNGAGVLACPAAAGGRPIGVVTEKACADLAPGRFFVDTSFGLLGKDSD